MYQEMLANEGYDNWNEYCTLVDWAQEEAEEEAAHEEYIKEEKFKYYELLSGVKHMNVGNYETDLENFKPLSNNFFHKLKFAFGAVKNDTSYLFFISNESIYVLEETNKRDFLAGKESITLSGKKISEIDLNEYDYFIVKSEVNNNKVYKELTENEKYKKHIKMLDGFCIVLNEELFEIVENAAGIVSNYSFEAKSKYIINELCEELNIKYKFEDKNVEKYYDDDEFEL